MQDLLLDSVGDPVVQIVLLFLGPFVLEEAALLGGAAVSASGELPPLVTLAALYAGIVVSDWALFAVGMLAGRLRRLRRIVGDDNIAFGQKVLRRGLIPAALTARLVPWLLLPIFVACGFLRVGFWRFAAINAGIALIYANVLFWLLYQFDTLLFESLDEWGWMVIAAVVVAAFVLVRLLSRRAERRP